MRLLLSTQPGQLTERGSQISSSTEGRVLFLEEGEEEKRGCPEHHIHLSMGTSHIEVPSNLQCDSYEPRSSVCGSAFLRQVLAVGHGTWTKPFMLRWEKHQRVPVP